MLVLLKRVVELPDNVVRRVEDGRPDVCEDVAESLDGLIRNLERAVHSVECLLHVGGPEDDGRHLAANLPHLPLGALPVLFALLAGRNEEVFV